MGAAKGTAGAGSGVLAAGASVVGGVAGAAVESAVGSTVTVASLALAWAAEVRRSRDLLLYQP